LIGRALSDPEQFRVPACNRPIPMRGGRAGRVASLCRRPSQLNDARSPRRVSIRWSGTASLPLHQSLSCAYFSKISRLYSSLTALREMCPFRSLAIFRRSGSVGARDFLLNLAKSWLVGPGVLPNSRSNHPMVSSPVILRITTPYHEFRTPGVKYGQYPPGPVGTDWQLRTHVELNIE
jgi:hypothetical protein